MKYYVRIINDEITSFGRSELVPKRCVEISYEEYEHLRNVLLSIPEKDGCYKVVHLHIHGTYTVEYFTENEEERDVI